MGRVTTWCALVAIVSGTLTVVAAPAYAASPKTSAVVASPSTADRQVPRRRAIITFDKNDDDPSSSMLTWKVVRRSADGTWQVIEEVAWRAGSGMLGKAGRNECAKGRGWLPNGTYRLRFHRNYRGNLIKGRAFRLDDHRCRNGRWRVQLFIHTEQSAHNTQCPDAAGDQVCRWEFPEVNDYKSAGCIKLAPADLAQLSRHFLQFYKAGVRYPKSRVVVRVVA
jgi:hypothetical protein